MNVKNKLLEYFPAFNHRNFTLFWCGQLVSLIGTWMQNTAMGWLVYDLTGNRFYVGLVNAVQFTPLLLFTLYAGVVIEKYPKRKLIILTQAIQAVGAFFLFVLMITHTIRYSYILIIMFCIGMAQSLDNPARQSFIVEMVDGREHLMNAIALNSAVFNGARLVGPALAALVLAQFGATWCFLLNAVSFIAVIIGLFMMIMDDKPVRTEVKNPGKDIIEGLKYIARTPKLLFTLVSAAIIPTFCINFNTLAPIFTRDVLKLQADAYGTLLSALGFGALISAVTVVARGKGEGAVRKQIIGSLGLSIALIVIGLVPIYSISVIMFAVCGFFMIAFTTTCNSVLQYNSPDNMRGRIMSVYSFVFGGLAPIGSLYAGATAKYLGSQYSFIISGIIGLFGLIIILMKRKELS